MEMLYLNSLTEPDPLTPPGGSSIDDFTGIKDDWPAEYLHPDMPVYTKGRISSWNTWDNYNPYDIFIIIKDTNQEDLDEYMMELQARGFMKVPVTTARISFQFTLSSAQRISLR